MIILVLLFSGCSERKAKELFEIAQFEELQKNQKHARQLYEEIIDKYPETDYAKKAEERLSQIPSSE
jgi:TolA-binding protein